MTKNCSVKSNEAVQLSERSKCVRAIYWVFIDKNKMARPNIEKKRLNVLIFDDNMTFVAMYTKQTLSVILCTGKLRGAYAVSSSLSREHRLRIFLYAISVK